MFRLMNCPASHDMQRGLHEETNEDADAGTRIHAALAGLKVDLNHDEADMVEAAMMQEEKLMQPYSELQIESIREQRFGMTQFGNVIQMTPDSKAKIRFSGQPDVVHLCKTADGRIAAAVIIDYKTGRKPAPAADENAQLASLAVLVYRHFKVWNITAAIIQPWCGKPTTVHYDATALKQAERWLEEQLARVENSTPEDTKAGEWCQYCKAKAICPAFREAALAQVERIEPITLAGKDGKTQRAAMFARAMEMPPQMLAGLVNGLPMVERYVDAIKGAAKDRAANDPEFQRHFVLTEKQRRRSVSDVGKLFERCHSHGVTAEAFTAECSIPIGAVKTILRTATGRKGKDLDALIEATLEGVTERGKPSQELTPTTATIEDEQV